MHAYVHRYGNRALDESPGHDLYWNAMVEKLARCPVSEFVCSPRSAIGMWFDFGFPARVKKISSEVGSTTGCHIRVPGTQVELIHIKQPLEVVGPLKIEHDQTKWYDKRR